MGVGIGLLCGAEGGLPYADGKGFDPYARPRPAPAPGVPLPAPGIRITDSGLKKIQEYVMAVREIVGWDIPLAADHFGHIGVEDAIKLAQGLDPCNLAWLGDMVPWV